MPLLDIDQLSVAYQTNQSLMAALEDVAVSVDAGEIVGLLGETGSGKSTLVHAILGTLPRRNARIMSGNIRLDGVDMIKDDKLARHARGRAVTFVPQDTYASLNPLFPVGTQIDDLMRFTTPAGIAQGFIEGRRQRETLAQEMLEAVQLPNGHHALRQYPHQLSGGQRQRIMLAMALLPRPKIIIADEPTASLDMTIQLEILKLFRAIAAQHGVGILFTTHSLGATWEICDRIVVMHGGRIIETAPRSSFFTRPLHPHTRRLFAATSRPGGEVPWPIGESLGQKSPGPGCQFNARCPRASSICRQERPLLSIADSGHQVACHNPRTDGAPLAYG